MLFNSIDFLIFFPIVVIIYFIVPRKLRYIWLLISSYYFYMSWNPYYAILIAISTVITWLCGICVGKLQFKLSVSNQTNGDESQISDKQTNNAKQLKFLCVASSFIINLGILAVFKYGNFALDNIDALLNALNITRIHYRFDLLLPVGISFYTFQALGYTMDVYRGTIKPEKNLLKYALFVSFFPQLVAGPIERSGNLLTQVQNVDKLKLWNYDRVRDGFFLMMWGLFQKLVIADRVAIIVNQVYDHYQEYGYGLIQIAVATILFAFQIYCDFNGYSTIARGAAKVMGFELMNNFKQPYLATSIKDFWRRWHISLTTWFTDYLYIPLGGNRKGQLRKYINILIVFAVSGLWHGASWNFVIWGLLHAIYQIVENAAFSHKKKKEQSAVVSFVTSVLGGVVTFIFVDFAWLFFRADDAPQAFKMIAQALHIFSFNGYGWGMEAYEIMIAVVAIGILLLVDILHEKNIALFEVINRRNIVIRWILYQGIIWTIIMLGVYGVEYDPSQFIYFQF